MTPVVRINIEADELTERDRKRWLKVAATLPVDISADRLCRLLKATSDGKFEPTGRVLELTRGFVAALADNRTSKLMREKKPLSSPVIEMRAKAPANLPDVSDVDAAALAKLRARKK